VVSTGPSCPHEGDDLGARTDNLHDWVAETIETKSGFPVRLLAVPAAAVLLVAVLLLLRRRAARR